MFIATQDPLLNTTEDFWRMVWEYKPSTIVMLTNETELSKVHSYVDCTTYDRIGYCTVDWYVNLASMFRNILQETFITCA